MSFEANKQLTVVPTIQKIYQVVQQMGFLKVHGLNGTPILFNSTFSHFINYDVVKATKTFFKIRYLLKEPN